MANTAAQKAAREKAEAAKVTETTTEEVTEVTASVNEADGKDTAPPADTDVKTDTVPPETDAGPNPALDAAGTESEKDEDDESTPPEVLVQDTTKPAIVVIIGNRLRTFADTMGPERATSKDDAVKQANVLFSAMAEIALMVPVDVKSQVISECADIMKANMGEGEAFNPKRIRQNVGSIRLSGKQRQASDLMLSLCESIASCGLEHTQKNAFDPKQFEGIVPDAHLSAIREFLGK